MSGHVLFCRIRFVAVMLLFLSMLSVELLAQSNLKPGIQELYRLDLLPVFKDSAKIASLSSYDRTGGNDDGFGGKYSYVRKEEDGLVLADFKGPGIIYRIWTPTPTDDMLEFYFDGESKPGVKVKFRELFMGKANPHQLIDNLNNNTQMFFDKAYNIFLYKPFPQPIKM